MKMMTISTKELRQDFGKVVAAMENGQPVLLLYRSRPLAELRPVLTEPLRPRRFAQARIQAWLKEDNLKESQSRRVNEIIKRLPR